MLWNRFLRWLYRVIRRLIFTYTIQIMQAGPFLPCFGLWLNSSSLYFPLKFHLIWLNETESKLRKAQNTLTNLGHWKGLRIYFLLIRGSSSFICLFSKSRSINWKPMYSKPYKTPGVQQWGHSFEKWKALSSLLPFPLFLLFAQYTHALK